MPGKGLGVGAAYQAAGYKPSEAAASRLLRNVKVKERVAELQSRAADKVVPSKQWVINRLVENDWPLCYGPTQPL
jgi:phage terminase small subunit